MIKMRTWKYQKLANENEKLKTDINYLEKKLEECEKEIDIYKNEKEDDENTINKLNKDISELQIEINEYKNTIEKLQNNCDTNYKEIESYKHLIEQYKEEISNLNAELDQYENETKAMDREIQTLKAKIIELNQIIENLQAELKEYELKKPKEKNVNEKFCELYQNFSKKKIIPHEIDMIIGLHLAKQERNQEKKYNNLLEVQGRLKKRINDLTGQINTYKNGKKFYDDLEDHKIEFELNSPKLEDNDYANKSQIIDSSRCNTYQRYKKITNIPRTYDYTSTNIKKAGDVIITTKTTQISYKRKRGKNNQVNQMNDDN